MATNNTQHSLDADSKRSQPNGTYNDMLNDTQFIPTSKPESLGISSQNSKTQNIRLLSDNEENRIIDSSLDFRDSISTQALLEKEPDTVVIKENDERSDRDRNQEEESIRLSDSKSSAPFKNFKLPDGDSPWLSKVKDPFNDCETPWLNKMRDPFKETPVNNKAFDALNETPNSSKKVPDFLNTPSASHKIFQRLRENNNRPELDLESQSIPAMFKDTQPILENPTQEREEDLRFNDTTINNTTINDDTTHNDDLDDEAPAQVDSTAEMVPTENDTQAIQTTQILEDTVAVEGHNQVIGQNEFKEDNTQADIQVPGTAPDPDISVDIEESVTVEESIGANIDKREEEDKSSPVNSDAEEESFPLNFGRRLHSEPVTGNYLNIMAEDSIQKYHRDLGKKVNESPADERQSLPHSKSFTNDTLQISQGKRLNSLPSRLDNDIIPIDAEGLSIIPDKDTQAIVSSSNEKSKLHKRSQPTSSPKVDESSPAIRQKDTLEFQQHKIASQDGSEKEAVDMNALAENVTQEFSDVDDESKIDNSLIEDMSKTQNSERNGSSSSNKIRKSTRTKAKKITYTSSPEKSFNQEDLSVVLDANTSQIYNDDYDLSVDGNRGTPDVLSKEFPDEILREETKELTERDILFKNSIWCLDNTRYYPGVIVGLSENGLNVKFFESTNEVTGSIFPLDIQIGDHVKVDRASYVVSGLECVIKDHDEIVVRCMRGYDTVLIKRLIGKGKRQRISESELRVPLEEIITENEFWHLRPRVLGEEQMVKPKRFTAKQLKTRKRLMPISYNEDELLSSAPVKRPKSKSSGLFNKCIFVITGEVDKDRLAQKIENNGGFVLDEGFAAHIKFANGDATSNFLQNYTFAALVTKKASRSSKFLETVALGWPLLSQAFIEDCIYENKFIDHIYPYALPSGELARIGGPKSSDLSLFIENWKLGYDLSSQLNNNRFLKNKIVFLCSKKNEEITKFMFNILGSQDVVILPLTNYTNFISKLSQYSSEANILVYHDNVSVIKSFLSSEKSRKSKKGSVLSQIVPINRDSSLDLVDWEWLVQCIIAGNLWRPNEQCKI